VNIDHQDKFGHTLSSLCQALIEGTLTEEQEKCYPDCYTEAAELNDMKLLIHQKMKLMAEQKKFEKLFELPSKSSDGET
jgi:hypothetical protein